MELFNILKNFFKKRYTSTGVIVESYKSVGIDLCPDKKFLTPEDISKSKFFKRIEIFYNSEKQYNENTIQYNLY